MLVADETQIIMKSFDPPDSQRYSVVRTFDLLSNIVAVTYDPEAEFIYWADNGRQRILRKNFRDKYAGFEVLYTEISELPLCFVSPASMQLENTWQIFSPAVTVSKYEKLCNFDPRLSVKTSK